MKGICVNFLDPDLFCSFKTLPWQPILGKICEMTFIQHAGILQTIQISQFCFREDKAHNFCYILCNFGEDRSTNPKDLAASFCTFWDETQKSTHHPKYLSKCWIELHQLFSISRLMSADYKTAAIVEETLQW